MMLLIDIGNTCLHWACAGPDSLYGKGAVVHKHSLSDQVMSAWQSGERPDRVLIASVASKQLTEAVQSWCVSHWGIEAEIIVAKEELAGVRNGYADAGQLGVDRWLAIVAAQRQYGQAVCVIDCGTALTADLVADDGRHLGGLIMPGLSMMRSALSEQTSAITEFESTVERRDIWLADNSRDAVLTGTRYMQLAVINEFVRDATELLHRRPNCVITGGGAASLRPDLDEYWHHNPDLVFHGMRIVAGSST